MLLPFAIKPALIRYTCKTTGTGEKQIKLISPRNQTMSSLAISSELAETSETQVHPSTVQGRSGQKWRLMHCRWGSYDWPCSRKKHSQTHRQGSQELSPAFRRTRSPGSVLKPSSTEDVSLVLQDVWNNLPAEFLQKPCASVPSRSDAVMMTNGGHTKLILFRFLFCSFC